MQGNGSFRKEDEEFMESKSNTKLSQTTMGHQQDNDEMVSLTLLPMI